MSLDLPFEQRPLYARIVYTVVRCTSLAFIVVTSGIRATGRNNIPAAGKTILMTNHASYYDVILLGIAQARNIDFMAKASLFFPIMGPFLKCMGSFPIQREGGGASGLKETFKRLRSGAMVGMFPEGTRTPDGKLQPLKPGVTSIARKSGSGVLCGGISGSFEAWPRSQPLPGFHPMVIHYCSLIPAAELSAMDDDAALNILNDTLSEACRVATEENKRLTHYCMF